VTKTDLRKLEPLTLPVSGKVFGSRKMSPSRETFDMAHTLAAPRAAGMSW
jgi:hypothetical protein